MNKDNIYSNTVISKNGGENLQFNDGKTFYSNYNPQKDAENFCKNEELMKATFIVIGGIAQAYHIDSLSKQNPNALIVAFESNEKTLEFIRSKGILDKFKENPNIIFTSSENLYEIIIQSFKGIIHKKFYSIFVRSWENQNATDIGTYNDSIKKALSAIQNDFSVQKHFGKIWMKNIFENCSLLLKNKNLSERKLNLSKSSICAIIAAGPSLDEQIQNLRQIKDKITIISTDTALSALLSYNIVPDFVFIIDAQIHSTRQIIQDNIMVLKDTVFMLDFCTNSSISRKLADCSIPLIFFRSSHPMCSYIERFSGSMLQLDCGNGTVTSAAFCFASKLNFKNIVFFGTDFSYPLNKSYCRQTYLDKTFSICSSKFNTIETQFSKLNYRTEIIYDKMPHPTTEILNRYCEKQIQMNNLSQSRIYNASGNINPMNLPVYNFETEKKLEKIDFSLSNPKINVNFFYELRSETLKLQKKLKNTNNYNELFSTDPLTVSLIPFFSHFATTNLSINRIINIAIKQIDNYTIEHE